MSFPAKENLKETNALTLKSVHDDLGAKLLREADVFVGGTISGIGKALKEKVDSPQHAGGTVLEMVGAYGAGYVLSRIQPKAALANLGKQTLGLAFSYSFLKDIGDKVKDVPKIWDKTWHSSDNLQDNKAAIADTWGRFAVDNTLTGIAGTRGAKRAYLTNQTRNVTRELTELLPRQNIVRVELNGGHGSGFVLDNHHIITAAHVGCEAGLARQVDIVTATGARTQARLVAMHPSADVALLRTDKPHGLKPLPVAESTSSIPEGTRVAELGAHEPGVFNRGPDFFRAATGSLNDARNMAQFNRKLKADLNPLEEALMNLTYRLNTLTGAKQIGSTYLKNGFLSADLIGSGPGLSGGPLIDLETKQVIGIVSCGPLAPREVMPSIQVPAERIHELSKLTERYQKAIHGIDKLSVVDASQRWKISEEEIVAGIKSGKIDAVQLFTSPVEQYNYMVLLDKELIPQYVEGRQLLKRVLESAQALVTTRGDMT